MVRISVELPDEVAKALARAAAEMQSTNEAVLVSVLQDFLAARDGFESFVADGEAFEAWIAEGEADGDAGRVVPAEQVFAELDAIIAAARVRRGE